MDKKETIEIKSAIKTAMKETHVLDIVIWDVVKPYKRDKFLQCIKDGMHWEAAYQTAKKARKPSLKKKLNL